MNRFAALLDTLSYQPQRNGKLRLIEAYLRETPDPDRGFALAALTGDLDFPHAKAGLIRALAAARTDPTLFALSYDFVGDLAETVALIWPATADHGAAPSLSAVVADLRNTPKAQVPALVAGLLDRLDATGRWALLKLMTGALRVGVSARLARVAVAGLGTIDATQIEEVWPSLTPPYRDLFAWVEGRGTRPAALAAAPFRPVMLSHPLDDGDLDNLDPAEFRAEWKWDGIRVQAVVDGATRRLYSRTGEDVGPAFPDLLARLDIDGVIDGELLVLTPGGEIAAFAELQQRLNRKAPTAAMITRRPAHLRAYDLLFDGAEDLRALPFDARRERLIARLEGRSVGSGIDISPLLPFTSWDDLAEIRATTAGTAVEGVMLKRRDSAYLAGRPKGPWWKWKRDPHLVDAVMMYAQRGHGKRSSFYSDFTFGVWRDTDDVLVPVGKAYFGFTDEELAQLDRWVRNHTRQRFGPVREVEQALVLEIAFEGLARSSRHKSGVAMRFPRINRIRWDKPAAEADRLSALEKLIR
ncbi:cisplatin damage response ATP-dependent DNA ligase [Oleomonas cavernae]|uniref:DNA ligase (ATP) n=1 Tax=Oleomonas cavernae TaxID=2320859 RepID=A0A418WHE0_9PROT|nr:cisplatin damage response ATP-dependent DNA ligase [Oleomonas cavernae]RJF89457.1 cisplatin damage response ATP-dependent DNA ligase [Oleomonas cavernae]